MIVVHIMVRFSMRSASSFMRRERRGPDSERLYSGEGLMRLLSERNDGEYVAELESTKRIM